MGRQGKRHSSSIVLALAASLILLVVLSLSDSADGGAGGFMADAAPQDGTGGLTVHASVDASAADGEAAGSDLLSTGLTSLFQDDVVALHSSPGDQAVTSVITLNGDQQAVVRWDNDTGVPAFLTGPVTPPAAADPVAATYAFLEANSGLYGMDDPKGELSLERVEQDGLGMTHLRLTQTYKGVPVYGSDLAFHFSEDGMIKAVNGSYHPGIDLSVQPGIGREEAVAAAMSHLGRDAVPAGDEPPQLMVLPQGGSSTVLVWKVTLESDEPLRMVYFVDAGDGGIVAAYDALEDVRDRRTYTANYGTSLPGTLMMTEGSPWTGDSVVNDAHYNAAMTYDYYMNTFGRDSINGQGMTIKSTVHYGSAYNNAFWNGSQITFGDGDGYVFSPLGSGLDVVAHELTHGVTQYTAGLVYSYQSGALNESYSDVMGAMVDRDGWLMGEDVYTPHTPGDALRSLSNPPQFGQPDHMNNYVNTSSDNGGVHTNSGIPNKAAYNVAAAIGKDKMEQIWYRALTDYLTSGAQFSDARDASVQAAADLYGASSAEVAAVDSGFAAVGITGSGMPSQTTARIEIDHTYRGDLVVTLGVGDPASPDWSTVVSNRQGGSADNLNVTVDISAAASHLPPSWGDRWFLKVYDAAGADTGQIRKFSITDHDDTYLSSDTPVPISDYQTSYAYVPTTDATPPTVISTDPVDGDTAVAMDADVTVSFSEAMDPDTIDSDSFRLERLDPPYGDVTATVSYDSGARKATLDPEDALGDVRNYRATVTSDVTDQAGNHLLEEEEWTFVVDPSLPSVTAVSPQGTVHTGNVTVAADYSDSDSGIDTASVTVTLDGGFVSGCNATDTRVSCPLTSLADGAHTIGGSVSDRAGNSSPINGSFTVDDTTAPPFGNLDGVSAGEPGSLNVSGWVIDPDTTDAIDVHIYVNGQFASALTADASRHDVGMAVPGYGDNHGFSGSVVTAAASNTVCAYGINNGPGDNVLLGCKVVNVQVNPYGSLDGVSVDSTGTIDVGGWAIDPDTASPVDVHVYVNGRFAGAISADGDRGDVGKAFPAYGDRHGFDGSVTADSSSNTVCAYGINTGAGGNALLGCRTVTLRVNPFGTLDSVSAGAPGRINLAGWAIDPNTGSALDVHVYVNGRFSGVLAANGDRPDVGAAYPGYGVSHGYSGSADTAAVNNVVCAYAINQGPGGNALLGCRMVSTPVSPFGSLDGVSRDGSGGLEISGWAIDPDSAGPIDVHIYVNGIFRSAVSADSLRADVGQVFPAYGDDHGFDTVLSDGPGPETVCAYGINTGPGGNALLGCRTV